MAQSWKASRRNIEKRMTNRRNRMPMSLEEVAKSAAHIVDQYNRAAYVQHISNGGTDEGFTKPLDNVKVVSGAVKRELKRTGRLDKFAKGYVSKD